jgi:hypothetical protein
MNSFKNRSAQCEGGEGYIIFKKGKCHLFFHRKFQNTSVKIMLDGRGHPLVSTEPFPFQNSMKTTFEFLSDFCLLFWDGGVEHLQVACASSLCCVVL